MEILKFMKLRDVKSPERGTPFSAGLDIFVPNDVEAQSLAPQKDLLIPSGLKVAIPHGYMLMGANKSGVATSRLACLRAGRKPKPNAFRSPVVLGAEIVDEDYQGEIFVHVINAGIDFVTIKPGMKIAQLIMVPVSYCETEEVREETELFTEQTARGEGGFGSTGGE